MTHFAIDNMKNDERRSVMLFLVCMISIELCSSMFNFGAKVSKGPTRIAVTGASGMVGQKLCTSLEARGNDVLKWSSVLEDSVHKSVCTGSSKVRHSKYN